MAEKDKKDNNKQTKIEDKKRRENTIKAESQGGVWITDQPNRNAEKNTKEEADFDKMTGSSEDEEENSK
ncbi:MAG: hypothetical protein ACOCXH_14680 [Cyclobacteriaceae bacterium]